MEGVWILIQIPKSLDSHHWSGCGACFYAVLRIRDPVPFWPLNPGSGIGFFRIPDLGLRIPDPKPIFWELRVSFLGKKFYNSLKIGPNFFLQHFKNKIVQFCEIFGSTKKGMTTNFFHLWFSLLLLDPRSGIRDGKIRIRDKHPRSATLFLGDSNESCLN